eukprot:tig00020553_g10693.t1
MSGAEPLSARAQEGRTALAAALAAARAWLEESEWHENARIEVIDGVREKWLSVSRKEPGLGFVRIRGGRRHKNEDIPFDAFLDSDAARALYDADTYAWTCWRPKGPDGSQFLNPGDAVPEGFKVTSWSPTGARVLAREKSPAALRDTEDQAEYEALRDKLYKIVFRAWQPVARGKRKAPWETAQSSDALTFFCEWLLLKAPLEKARFFLSGPSEEEMAKELDAGANPSAEGYVDEDGYLKGYDSNVARLESLDLFRRRRGELAIAQRGARAQEGRGALAAALAAARAWLEESERHESARIEVLDGVRKTWLLLSREEPGPGVVLVQQLYLGPGVEAEIPFDAFLDSDAARALYDADTYAWTCWRPMGPGDVERKPGDELPGGYKAAVLERDKSPAALRDTEDEAGYRSIQEKLFDLLFPVWLPVASGEREAVWQSAQSSDALTFFCEWLLLKAPLEKARFFLSGPSQEAIAAELDAGANPSAEGYAYVDEDGYLQGYDSDDRPLEALELFRGRRAALALQPAPLAAPAAAAQR